MKRIHFWRSAFCIAISIAICSFSVPIQNPLQVYAASFEDINDYSVFLKQNPRTCTLCSAAMLLRRTAILQGDPDWRDITESSIRSTAWKEGAGLYLDFTYNGIHVTNGTLNGTESQLIDLLNEHPEGIIIYNTSVPHAVLLTDYTDGTFWAADPANGTPIGRIPLTSCYKVRTNNVSRYWYVESPDVNIDDPIPPQNVSLDKNQYWYDIKDTIELYPSADNANRFYMAIYKNDTVVRDGWITGTYSIAASELGYGDYVVWVTAANSAGTADSNHLEIPIVGAPGYTGVHTTMPLYSLNDTVSISVDTVCAKGAVIGIDRNGVERAITEGCNKGIGTYEIAASSLGVGDYSAYFSVYNGSGSIDTERVSFKIYDSAPSISVLSANKTEITVGEEITFTASSDCATGYTMGIDDVNGRYLTPDMNNGELTLSFDKPGNYSAYVTSYNSIGYCDSQRIEFSVYSAKPVSGDCNNDGELNVADVILLQKWLLAVPDTHFENWKAADMCEDDRLDVFDLCLMKRKLINKT